MDTKFYFIDEDKPAEEISLDRSNMFFVQMYGSIRCAFLNHGLPLPQYAYIDKSYEKTKHMEILLIMPYRPDKYDEFKMLCAKEELGRQARANSDEDIMTYEFNIH